MTEPQAREICDLLEAAIKNVLTGVIVTVHVAPEHEARHSPIFAA